MSLKVGDFLVCEIGNYKCVLLYETNIGLHNLKVIKHISGNWWDKYYSVGILDLCRKLTDEEKLELL